MKVVVTPDRRLPMRTTRRKRQSAPAAAGRAMPVKAVPVGDDVASEVGTLTFLDQVLADPAVGLTLRRLVTDPMTGHLIDRGRTAYVVPQSLRAFITTRDRHCRFPGCRRKAISCQIDHAESWDDRGRTDRFVGMYVNDWTRDAGPAGKEAVRRFLGEAADRGLVPRVVPEFQER